MPTWMPSYRAVAHTGQALKQTLSRSAALSPVRPMHIRYRVLLSWEKWVPFIERWREAEGAEKDRTRGSGSCQGQPACPRVQGGCSSSPKVISSLFSSK